LAQNSNYTIHVTQEGTTYTYSAEVGTSDITATKNESNTFADAFAYGGASIRTTDPKGIRFSHLISNDLKEASIEENGYEVQEYGILVQKEDALLVDDTLSENVKSSKYIDFKLDDGLNAVGGIKGVFFNRKIDPQVDIIYELGAEKTRYVGVLMNISEPNNSTQYAVKPYIVINYGASIDVVYGSINTSSMADVAVSALSAESFSEQEEAFLRSIID
jgi:hypothetical protein